MPDLSIHDCLKKAEAKLYSIDDPQLSAIILMAHLLNQTKTWVLAYTEETLSESQYQAFFALVERLAEGEPLPYITGKQSFYGLDFKVNPAVLIPRPETELLVDEALKWLQDQPDEKQILDVGTGSGCIAISLAKNSHNNPIKATDISEDALKIAAENAKTHGVENRISFVQANLLENFKGKVDLICANLPYIPTTSLAELEVINWEPALALDGGMDGLSLIGKLLDQSLHHLNIPGLILLEIDSTTGESAFSLARHFYPNADIHLLNDLAGKSRLLLIEVLK